MIKKILLILFIFSLFRIAFVLMNDNHSYKEENKKIKGKITNIIKYEEKTIIDVDRKYRVTLYKKANYNLGDYVLLEGVFKTPSNNTVFNLFNYRKYLLSKKIKMISDDVNITVINKNKNVFYKIKNNIIKRISSLKSEKYLRTFILADSSKIEENIKQGYRNIGISHLFAISGMHVGIFLFFINKFLGKYKYKNIVVLLFMLFFLFLTNFTESLLRCAMFIFLSMINKKFKLEIKNEVLLLFTASLLILTNPYMIYSVSFIFSITITFFIILSSNHLKEKTYIKKLIYISIICFLASIPILSFSFFKINLLTPIYNVIFVPIISFIIFPLSLITFFIPFFDNVYSQILNVLEYIILSLDNIKLFTFALSKCNLIIIFAYYLFLILAIRINKKYIILFLIILFININSRFLIANPHITFLDVGQGDCSIIILPKGKTILVDTGGFYNDKGKISKNKIIPYLNSNGMSSIEYLIITHGDQDHIGGALTLVENFKVEKVIFNCGEFNELEKDLIKVLDKKKIPYYSCIKELNIDDNKLYFLNNKDYGNENDNSSVIYTELNGYKFMFMGDAGIEVEEDLIEKYNLKDTDVLKVGHHGSKTSTGKEFVGVINPKHSIISVGKNNRYGHPNDSVLQNLNDSKIYRTDQDGSIMFKIKNNKLEIETCAP